MVDILNNFHFLRPWLLTLIIPVAFLLWFALRAQKLRQGAQVHIAEHLLVHLQVGKNSQQKIQPVYVLALCWCVGIIAVAGPTWQKEVSPFTEDTAGLVIALKMTPSMLAQDVQPSRLERATQKIQDLLSLRAATKTALVAYAGSAHLTMPFTVDPNVINMFSQALTPEIMPEEGDAPEKALQLGGASLERAEIPGSILLIADQIENDRLAPMQEFWEKTGIPVHIYAIGAENGADVPSSGPPAPPLNIDGMKKAADAVSGSLTIVTPDEGDIRRLAKRIQTNLSIVKQSEGERWRDLGYWLLPLLLLVSLLFFRRGWIVEYE